MVTVTREDKARAQETIREIDAAPAEDGGTPIVTSNTDVAKDIIARTIAETREEYAQAPGPGDCSDIEAQYAACQASHEDTLGQLAKAEENAEIHQAEIRTLTEDLIETKDANEAMSLKVRIFNHTAVGLTAMLNVHAQELQAQAQAQEAAEAMAKAQEDVVEGVKE